MCIDANTTKEVVIETTKNKRRLALIARDKSKASQFATEIGAKSNIALRELEIKHALNHTGVNALVQVRTSTFMYTNNYVFNKKNP